MTYLIDTDWVADYLKGTANAVALLTSLSQDRIAISLVTYGEIYEGIYYGPDQTRYERVFSAFLRDVDILFLDRDIMDRFAHIRGHLRAMGNLIPDFDLLIAATAIHHQLTLVTRNVRHFQRVPSLVIHQ